MTAFLLHITENIQQGFYHDIVTATLFIDIKAAFDKVNHKALLIKLHNIGIRGRMAEYIRNFFSERRIAVRIGNTTSAFIQIDNGVAQGSPLSPTLFLILINDIYNKIDVKITNNLILEINKLELKNILIEYFADGSFVGDHKQIFSEP